MELLILKTAKDIAEQQERDSKVTYFILTLNKNYGVLKVYVVLKVEVNADAVFGEDLPKQKILGVWKGEEHLKPEVEALASMSLDNSRRYEIVIEEWEVKE